MFAPIMVGKQEKIPAADPADGWPVFIS